MKNSIDITRNPSEMEGAWTVSEFLKAYPQPAGITGCAIASLSAEPGNPDPDKLAMITCRIFIENGDRAKNGQKYIVGIRFYSHGDMATIDVISLDKGFHKDICFEHLQRMGWPSFDEQTGKSVDKLKETDRAPLLFVGGHLKVNSGTHVDFTGSSGDYGSNILYSDSNSIAAYVASICGIEVGKGDKKKGETFVQEVLELMLKHKTHPDFYEQLVQEVFEKTPARKSFTAQHLGALMTMKVIDRHLAEGKDMLTLMVEEVSGGGLSRHIMLHGFVKQMKATANQAED